MTSARRPTTVLTDASRQSSRAIWSRRATWSANRQIPLPSDKSVIEGSACSLVPRPQAKEPGPWKTFTAFGLPPYLFEQVNRRRRRRATRAAIHRPRAWGNPELLRRRTSSISSITIVTAHRPFSSSRGIGGIAAAQAAYYSRRFVVKAQSGTEIVPTLGLERRIRQCATAIPGPGDFIVVPNPSYPISFFRFSDGRSCNPRLASGAQPSFFDRLSGDHPLHSPPLRFRLLSLQSSRRRRARFLQGTDLICEKHGVFGSLDLAYVEV